MDREQLIQQATDAIVALNTDTERKLVAALHDLAPEATHVRIERIPSDDSPESWFEVTALSYDGAEFIELLRLMDAERIDELKIDAISELTGDLVEAFDERWSSMASWIDAPIDFIDRTKVG